MLFLFYYSNSDHAGSIKQQAMPLPITGGKELMDFYYPGLAYEKIANAVVYNI